MEANNNNNFIYVLIFYKTKKISQQNLTSLDLQPKYLSEKPLSSDAYSIFPLEMFSDSTVE